MTSPADKLVELLAQGEPSSPVRFGNVLAVSGDTLMVEFSPGGGAPQ
jgi:hypothetical protein